CFMPAMLGRRAPHAFTKLLTPLPPASPGIARGIMGNIRPHGIEGRHLEAAFVEDPSALASDPLVVLTHPGLRRLQSEHCGQYKPASLRLQFAGIFTVRDGAVGDRVAGLALIEFAKLPDQPPQTL